MRQIDNMTPQELDTLALKGMTAPRTASERNKAKPKIVVRRDMTPDYEREAQRDRDRLQGNKAQHSPLRTTDDSTDTRVLDNIRRYRRKAAHADKLAGALRNALNMIDPFVWDKSKEAAILDAYEDQLNKKENP